MTLLVPILGWLAEAATVPNILLLFLTALSAWVLVTAQRHPTFDIGLMLTDDKGKPSSSRFAVLISLGITSYIVVYAFIHKLVGDAMLFNLFCAYIITWASSKAVEKLIDAWAASKTANDAPKTTTEEK